MRTYFLLLFLLTGAKSYSQTGLGSLMVNSYVYEDKPADGKANDSMKVRVVCERLKVDTVHVFSQQINSRIDLKPGVYDVYWLDNLQERHIEGIIISADRITFIKLEPLKKKKRRKIIRKG